MIVHAAGESSPGNLPDTTHAVVLVAKDERALGELAERLRARAIGFVECREPDAPYAGALMALGIRPARKEDIRRHVSQLPLLR